MKGQRQRKKSSMKTKTASKYSSLSSYTDNVVAVKTKLNVSGGGRSATPQIAPRKLKRNLKVTMADGYRTNQSAQKKQVDHSENEPYFLQQQSVEEQKFNTADKPSGYGGQKTYDERMVVDPDVQLANWFEIRVNGKSPERRAYHTTFVIEDKLFIYGGKDIREGQLDTMWMLHLDFLKQYKDAKDLGSLSSQVKIIQPKWMQVEVRGGGQPGKLSHHTSCVYGKRMFLYGGNRPSGEINSQLYFYDTVSQKWEIMKTRGHSPGPLDEHSAVMREDGTMYVFGGFNSNGEMTNLLFEYQTRESMWSLVEPVSDDEPCPRAGHSCVIHKDKLYIFGGKANDQKRLNDIWCFDLKLNVWETVVTGSIDDDQAFTPMTRSGAVTILHRSKMFIYGGIHNVLQELDDLSCLDFEQMRWYQIQDNRKLNYSAAQARNQHLTGEEPFKRLQTLHNSIQSPDRKKSLKQLLKKKSSMGLGQYDSIQDTSQASIGARSRAGTITSNKSPTRTSIKSKSLASVGRVPGKPLSHILNNLPEALVDLVSPTSSQMKNSFIMTNGSREYNDQMYRMIIQKKRFGINAINRQIATPLLGDRSMTLTKPSTLTIQMQESQPSIGHSIESAAGGISSTFVNLKRPAARDGHSASFVFGRFMLVFGGDRHHMPFNDLHVLDLDKEIEKQGYLFGDDDF